MSIKKVDNEIMIKLKFIPLAIFILMLIPGSAFSQTAKILYVSSEHQTGPVYDKINEQLAAGLQACLQEKFAQKINSITWESMNPKFFAYGSLPLYFLKASVETLDPITKFFRES